MLRTLQRREDKGQQDRKDGNVPWSRGMDILERLSFSYLSIRLMISSFLLPPSCRQREGHFLVLAPALEEILHNLVELKHPFEITILIISRVTSQIELKKAGKNRLGTN